MKEKIPSPAAPSRHPAVILLHGLMFSAMAFLPACGKEAGSEGEGSGAKAGDVSDAPAKALDLASFPVMDGAEPARQKALAGLSYRVASDVPAAFEFQKKHLAALHWKELPGSSVTAEYASGSFAGGGFHVSVSVMPAGQAGFVDVLLKNHGDVDITKLPLPPGTKPVYVGPLTAMHLAETPVAETAEACRKLLLAEGWEPYGTAGEAAFFKRGAVRILVSVASAPAQEGKTMISFTSELLSSDLPAPAETVGLEYADVTRQLSFESVLTQKDLESFYRQAMEKIGWKPTMEKMVEVGGMETLIFRNPAKDMITLAMIAGNDGRTKVTLQLQTVAEIEEMNRHLDAQAAAHKAKTMAAPPVETLKVTLPTGASGLKKSTDGLQFSVSNGQARAAVGELRKQFGEAGWVESVAVLEDLGGTVVLGKEGKTLTVTYTDTGVIPPEIAVTAAGVVLE